MEQRDEKREQFTQTSATKKGKGLMAGAVALVVIAGAAAFFLLQGPGTVAAGEVVAKDGKVEIPLAQVSDGKAHFFTYRSEKAPVKFFVLKSSDGIVRSAFDTCDVCYKAQKGYRQEGDFMVCNNCNQKFQSNMINEVKGGCNPAPLHREVTGDKLVITSKDLSAGSWYFAN